MSYSDTENEHHEAVSGGIVALRNEVAKLTASAQNMRGQGLACDDADRARALYESSAAYADAAYRVGLIVNDFEQAESYRAGAMEAIGPVLTYDHLESRNRTLQSEVDSGREFRARLNDALNVMDAALGGNGSASPEELGVWVESTAKALRRFRGIRDTAVSLLDSVGGQHSAHTLVDLLTILLDGDAPETLAKFKAAIGVGQPVSAFGIFQEMTDRLQQDRFPRLEIPKGLHEQAMRVTGQAPSVRWEPVLGDNPEPTDPAVIPASQLDDTTPYVGKLDNGGLFVGLCVGVTDAGKVKLQRPVKSGTATEDWGVRLEEVDPESVRRADTATAEEFELLVEQADAETHGLEPEAWRPRLGAIVSGVALDVNQRRVAQYVRATADPSKCVAQFIGLTAGEPAMVEAEFDTLSLRAATDAEIAEFTESVTVGGLTREAEIQ